MRMVVPKSTTLVAVLAGALLWGWTLLLGGKDGVPSGTTLSLLRRRNLLSSGFINDPKTIESKGEDRLGVIATADSLPNGGNDNVLDISFIDRKWNSMWRFSKAYRRGPNGVLGPNGVMLQGREYTEEQGWSLQELFDHFPVPRSSDTIHMYNKRAWQKFRYLLLNDNNRQVNVCINGGSVSAGGGHIVSDDRYYSQFFKYVHHLRGFTHAPAEAMFNIHGMAHGARGSLHSAVFAHNLIPPNTDIIMWEFALNDHYFSDNDIRSDLVAWLQEVEKLQPTPMVILVYLDFFRNNTYKAHAMLAKQFDFVVGHINAASYLDETKGSLGLLDEKDVYTVDGSHASKSGHITAAFLLLNLLKGMGPWTPIPSAIATGNDYPIKYDWPCGTKTGEELFVKSKVVDGNSVSGWKSPKGAATMELPQNEGVGSSPRRMFFDIGPNEKTGTMGKSDPARTDRQAVADVPCCGTGLYTTISLYEEWRNKPLQNATALFTAFHQYSPKQKKFELKVHVENSVQEVKAVPGNFFWATQRKECSWSFYQQLKTGWFSFAEPQHDILKVHVCVSNRGCFVKGKTNKLLGDDKFSGAMLSGLAIY